MVVGSVARFGVFPPDPRNSALVLGNSVRVWGILALVFKYPKYNYLNGSLEQPTWQLWWYDHLVPSGCLAPALEVLGSQAHLILRLGYRLLWLALRSFSWEFHHMKCLREVMFAVWVHGYAGRMWHPFV